MFEDIYDEIEVVPSKKVGKRKTGSAYRRKMKRKHLEQVRRNGEAYRGNQYKKV